MLAKKPTTNANHCPVKNSNEIFPINILFLDYSMKTSIQKRFIRKMIRNEFELILIKIKQFQKHSFMIYLQNAGKINSYVS